MSGTPRAGAISSQAKPYTLTNAARRGALIAALDKIDADGIAGDIVECGVWRGGNIIIARKVSPERVCWLYDTFTGMTEPEDIDASRSGEKAIRRYQDRKATNQPWCRASVDEVKDALNACGVFDETKLRFVEGDIVETLKLDENRPRQIALLRLDTDWYASTKAELEILYPLLAPGGVLIVDDYGHWAGARKAVDEYFAGKEIGMTFIDYSAVAMVKPC